MGLTSFAALLQLLSQVVRLYVMERTQGYIQRTSFSAAFQHLVYNVQDISIFVQMTLEMLSMVLEQTHREHQQLHLAEIIQSFLD